MVKKAIAYVRVSSKEQEKEGYSISAQKKLLAKYAEKNNLQIVHFFEEAETAKMAGRKQFRKLIEFLDSNPDCKDILVEKTDRMYRNFYDLVALDIDNRNLYLHLVKEGQILSKDSKSHDKLQHDIKLVLARNYVNNLSEEVKKGLNEKVAQGGWPGAAPLGYKNRLEDRTIIVHPEDGPLVAKAFQLASTGQYSLSRLKKEMYSLGLRSKRAKKELSKSTMSNLLKNPVYYGSILYRGSLYPGKHEPIVNKRLFDQVQEVMGYSRAPSVGKHVFNYRGLLSCGHCGCAVTVEKKTKKSGKTFVYYHCTNGKGICENVTYLREEVVDDAIQRALSKIRLTKDVVEWTREALLESSTEEREYRQAQVRSLTNRYNKLDSMISQAYEDKLEGHIEPEFWETKTSAWKSEQSEITIQLEALKQANTDFMLEGVKYMELATRAAELFKDMTPEEKRETADLVLSNPRVVNGSIEYDYKKPFNLFVNVTDLTKWRG